MSKNTTTPTSVNPMVLAVLASRKPKNGELLERIAERVVSAGTATARFAGQISAAVSVDNFTDGRKAQQLSAIQSRALYWDRVAIKHGLSPSDVAALLDA